MNVLLIHPDSPFLVDSKTFPPLGILYLGAALESEGHKVTCIDLAHGGNINGFNPDVIGTSAVTPHIPGLAGLVSSLHKTYQGVPIIVGGPHFSTRPTDYKRVGADCAGAGDCEEAILTFVNDVAQGRKLKEVYSSPGSITDVNRWPIPARHLLPIKLYRYAIAGMPATTVITQRGCPYECTFCCHWEGYRKIRLRHIDNVVEEIRQLKVLGFQGVMIYDDEINIVHKRTIALCEAMAGERISWRAFIKANLFNGEQARAFAKSGCWEVCTGVESGDDGILKTIQKKATVADNTNARNLCRDLGIRFKAFTMIGHPGETYETAMATKQWLLDNAPDEFNLSVYTPYLGTPVVDDPRRFDIHFDTGLDYFREEYFYRGRPGEYQANASTSALSGEQLVKLRAEIEDEVRDRLNLPTQGTPGTYYAPRPPDSYVTTEAG